MRPLHIYPRCVRRMSAKPHCLCIGRVRGVLCTLEEERGDAWVSGAVEAREMRIGVDFGVLCRAGALGK